MEKLVPVQSHATNWYRSQIQTQTLYFQSPTRKQYTKLRRDFPGGPVVKTPPSNAGDAGSIPGPGAKISHAAGQLSLHATTTEPTHHNYRARAL